MMHRHSCKCKLQISSLYSSILKSNAAFVKVAWLLGFLDAAKFKVVARVRGCSFSKCKFYQHIRSGIILCESYVEFLPCEVVHFPWWCLSFLRQRAHNSNKSQWASILYLLFSTTAWVAMKREEKETIFSLFDASIIRLIVNR